MSFFCVDFSWLGVVYCSWEVIDVNENFDIHFFGDTVCELRPLSYGHRRCERGFFRPIEINTDFYILHYIASGKGVFEKNGVSYPVRGGQVFISRPYEVFNFRGDDSDPFHYIWVRFMGKSATKLDTLPTVTETDGAPFFNMINGIATEEYVTAQLYLIVNALSHTSEKHSDYVSVIKNYVRDHETGNVTVEEIRTHLNLNRQYMSTLFKSKTGISLQEYIILNRIEKAKLMLSRGFTVTEAAVHCGYSSVYAFSKAFKRAVGSPPTEFRYGKN